MKVITSGDYNYKRLTLTINLLLAKNNKTGKAI